MSMFKNGNRRIARMMLWELGAGTALIIIMQVQGMIPSQDWITPETAKKVAFGLAVAGTVVKAVELFFSKTVSMFKDHDIPDDLDEPVPAPAKPIQAAAPIAAAPVASPAPA